MRFRSVITLLLTSGAFGLLALVCSPEEAVRHQVALGNYTLSYELSESRRLDRVNFEYVFRIDLTNHGTLDLVNGTFAVTSHSPESSVIDGSVSFGHSPVGSTTTALDTFSIRQDRRVPFVPTALGWDLISATAVSSPAGWRAEFPGGGTILSSPTTAQRIDDLGEDAVETPSEIGIETWPNPGALPLDQFIDQLEGGYYSDYERETSIEVDGLPALRLDDRHSLPFPKLPAVVVFVDAPPNVVEIGFNRQTISDSSLSVFDEFVFSMTIR